MTLLGRLSGAIDPPQLGPALELVRGPKHWPLGLRPLALGRAPECDIQVPGESVSRLHAWVVPSNEGPVVIDHSRHGVRVNGEPLTAPRLLQPGDALEIGEVKYQVQDAARPGAVAVPRAGRIRRWLVRYGPSEVLGTVASVGVAVTVQQASGSTVIAAYAAAVAENVVFYGIMFLRESVREAHHAGIRGRPFGSADLLPVARNLMLEFGVAELLDTLLVRPLMMGLGLRLIGGNLGGLVGKLSADLVFYGPVLTLYEWRLARHRSVTATDRRRRTTAAPARPPEALE